MTIERRIRRIVATAARRRVTIRVSAARRGSTMLARAERGGAGAKLGAALGAVIFGMVSQGFFFTNIDNNWFQTFIGGMLLVAVLVNTYIRSSALRRDSK